MAVISIYFTACGGSTGGGAAPTGSGGTPVAVEIPAVNDIGDIMYITGPVVASGSGNLSAKSLGGISTAKDSLSATYSTGESINACITANVMRGVFKSGAMPDVMSCILKNYVEPGMATQGVTNIYTGQNFDAAAWVQKSHGVEQVKFRFNIPKNSTGSLAQFTVYVCGCVDEACHISSQTQYMKQIYEENAVTITSKEIETSGYSSIVGVTGTTKIVDDIAQFDSKTITQSSRNETTNNEGDTSTYTQRTIFLQGEDAVTVDGFQRGAGEGISDTRVYGNFGFTYTGVPAPYVDFDKYDYGAGASNLIDGLLDQTQCWDGDGKIAAFPCIPYSTGIIGKTPMAVSDVPAAAFEGVEVIDCSAIVPTYTQGTKNRPLTIETSLCSGFKELDSHMECYTDIYGRFTVTPSYNGTTLSTNAASPTIVTSSTPTIRLTTNYNAGVLTFNAGNLQVSTYNAPPGWESLVGTVDSDYNNWNSDVTVLSLTYNTLYNTFEYSLTLSGQKGVDYSTSVVPAVYYIKYIAP